MTPRRLRRGLFANARRTRGWPRNRTKYAYVYNDPFNRWDPTGLDALVILRDNNVVEITLPVIWSGNAATESNVSSAAGNIGSVWSGQKGKYSVTTTVAALAPGAEKTEPVFNTASLTEEPTDRNNGHSYVRDNSEAHITMKDVRGETIGSTRGVKGSNTTAHEAGHLLGLENKEGDSGNIMDTGTGSGVSEADIDAVINSNINTIQDCRSLAGSAPAC